MGETRERGKERREDVRERRDEERSRLFSGDFRSENRAISGEFVAFLSGNYWLCCVGEETREGDESVGR